MKKFITKAFWFAIGLLLAGYAIEGFLFVRMQDKRAHVHEDWPDLVGLEADFVFIGNSRTAGHVMPKRIAPQGLQGYNIAYDGYTVQMGAYRLDYLLKQCKRKPRYVFLQTDLSFASGDGKSDNYPMKDGVLRYFLFDQIGINNYYRNYQNWREADTFIPLLRYKGYPLIFIKHLLGWNKWDRRAKLGFWHTDKEVGFQLPEAATLRSDQISLCSIDSICANHGIELIGLIPPSPGSFYKPSDAALAALPEEMHVWDFSALFSKDESSFFYDRAHFSFEGAEQYSDSISSRFERFLLSKNMN